MLCAVYSAMVIILCVMIKTKSVASKTSIFPILSYQSSWKENESIQQKQPDNIAGQETIKGQASDTSWQVQQIQESCVQSQEIDNSFWWSR